MNIYLVGGAVRDTLLGLEVKDKDWLVTGSTPEYFLSQGYEQVGADFPVFLHPETKEEYALARTERKIGTGYNGFATTFDPTVTVEEDCKRRDLTINSIAMDSNGNYIDPYGGIEDLKNKVLKHVSDHFVEDPLRVLRVARFMARYGDLGFTVHPDTMALMRQIGLNGELSHLTSERIFKELEKVFTEPNPSYFFQVLKDSDTLQFIFPEIDDLFGVPQPEAHHPEIDTGIHVLMVLSRAKMLSPNNNAVMYAALMHDLGKGLTPKTLLPAHHGHEEAGVELVSNVSCRLKVPSYYKKLAEFSCRYHTQCHNAFNLKEKTIYDLFKAADAYRNPSILKDFFIVCKADAQGRTGYENRDYEQIEYLDYLYEKSKHVDTKSLIDSGIKGKDLGLSIERIRISNIFKYKDLYPKFLQPIAESCRDRINNIYSATFEEITQLFSIANVQHGTEKLEAILKYHNIQNDKLIALASEYSNITGKKFLALGYKGLEIPKQIAQEREMLILKFKE
jgi:tRNA nucleotidyltransferase (CCA-adding enzyme)